MESYADLDKEGVESTAYNRWSAPGCVDHELMPSTFFETEGKSIRGSSEVDTTQQDGIDG